MAKDGTLRGNAPGNSRGAGRKRKPLTDRIAEGKENLSFVIQTPADVAILDEPDELTAEEMPPFDQFMTAVQRTGTELCSKMIAEQTNRWLKARGCLHLVNPVLVMQYSQLVARWIQTDLLISDKGLLAKHPTTGAPTTSPYVSEGLNYLRQANVAWATIYQIVRENCSTPYSGNTPQEDAMEVLLQMRSTQRFMG
ncbi:hypothetical protein FACS1894184_15100 [Clostridia bacterium]|nr:hypothetical protein FACS1894184_15100 [Clostridia bacterium]